MIPNDNVNRFRFPRWSINSCIFLGCLTLFGILLIYIGYLSDAPVMSSVGLSIAAVGLIGLGILVLVWFYILIRDTVLGVAKLIRKISR